MSPKTTGFTCIVGPSRKKFAWKQKLAKFIYIVSQLRNNIKGRRGMRWLMMKNNSAKQVKNNLAEHGKSRGGSDIKCEILIRNCIIHCAT